MNIILNDLQKSTIESYNRLVYLLNKSKKDHDAERLIINANELEKRIGDLHNNLVFFGSLMDSDGKSYLDGDVKMDQFEF